MCNTLHTCFVESSLSIHIRFENPPGTPVDVCIGCLMSADFTIESLMKFCCIFRVYQAAEDEDRLVP